MTDKTKIDVVVERLRREKKKEKRRVLFLGMLSIVVFLLIWQSVCVFHIVGENALVSPCLLYTSRCV